MKKAEILKKLIAEKGIGLREFSRQADLPYTTLRSILERGAGKASVDNILKICKALNITTEDLERMANGEDLKDGNIFTTIAAHHDGETWTEEELQDIEEFKQFLLSKRKK